MIRTIMNLGLVIAIVMVYPISAQDPCLEYEEGTQHCKNCSNNYIYALINETTTLCANVDKNTSLCFLNDSFYSLDPAFQSSFSLLTTFTFDHQYCFNCTTFFTLESGENACYSGCPYVEPTDYLEMNIADTSIGCDVCALKDRQMQTMLDYSFIELLVKTCTPNREDTACSFKEVYNPELGRCVACIDMFPSCAACTQDKCLTTAYQYYEESYLFNYETGLFNKAELTYNICGRERGMSAYSQVCKSSTIENCLQSMFFGFEYCYYCTPNTTTSWFGGCPLNVDTREDIIYFIKSGATLYNQSDGIRDVYFKNGGTSIDKPIYFIADAMRRTNSKASSVHYINVTMYLSKGDHFFFYCDERSGSLFNTPEIMQYCSGYSSFRFPLQQQSSQKHDNIHIVMKPLYCSLGEQLGLAANQSFLSMCLEEGEKPIIFVNQGYAYFEIFGTARFEDIIFTGVNQLFQPVIQSDDLTSLPVQLCKAAKEPEIGQQLLELEKTQSDDFPISYKCFNRNYTGSDIPKTSNSTFTCGRNAYANFYGEQESTFSCSGEPSYYYYFKQNQYSLPYSAVSRRINTLFNVIPLPEYNSVYLKPPVLEIVNCTFEYFLGNYESLINVMTKNLNIQDHTNYVVYNLTDYYTYMSSVSGERGAKISILNSEFKHSSFCKGLLVYRKQPYIRNDVFGFGNWTYYLMSDPYVRDEGSYIVLRNSTFRNLNAGFQNVSALAIYKGQEVLRTVDFGKTKYQYQALIHKGTVLNVEDFGGYISITNCTFEYNMHFIPQALSGPQKQSEKLSVSDFFDTSQTKEVKMAICDSNSGTDKYFLSHGLSEEDDLEAMYDQFERLSTIYISRNKEQVVLRDNVFHSNIGTFGGAISINSQNWDEGRQPFVLIENNNFTNNMAYFSGNAVYIRNSLRTVNSTAMCGGIEVRKNYFLKNVGGSHYSLGGALSISCNYMSNEKAEDYLSSSTQFMGNRSEDYKNKKMNFTDKFTNMTLEVYQYTVNIENNTFCENLAGTKGTALYIKQINSIRISQCLFKENGPFLSVLEADISPYAQYLAHRTLAFTNYDTNCSNEFDFVANCQTSEGKTPQWSHVKGAVYVEHCQTMECLTADMVMELAIEDSVFNNNQVGYVMDDCFPSDLTSQIQIVGGFSNLIARCSFEDSRGLYEEWVPDKLKAFFLDGYYGYQQGSLLSVSYDFDSTTLGYSGELKTTISECNFTNNKHFQALGFGKSKYFQGSLVRVTNVGKSSSIVPVLALERSLVRGNVFIGKSSQLIYALDVLVQATDNVFEENGGHLHKEDTFQIEESTDYFPFSAYEQLYYQDYGLIHIEGLTSFPGSYSHQIHNNTFSHSFSLRGSVLFLNIGNQFLSLSNNHFFRNVALRGGIIGCTGEIYSNLFQEISHSLSISANATLLARSNRFEQQVSQSGVFDFMMQDSGLTLNLVVGDSHFEDNFQFDEYSTFSLQGIGKVVVNESNFTMGRGKEEVRELFEQDAAAATTSNQQEMANVLYHITDEHFESAKFLYANSTSNAEPEVYFLGQLLPQSSEYYSYIEVLNCNFQNFFSERSGALLTLALDSKVVMWNEEEGQQAVRNCTVGNYGIVHISASEFVARNLKIVESGSRQSTGLIYATAGSHAELRNSFIGNNFADTYGMIYVTGSSSFICEYCTFTSNRVSVDSSILYADNNPQGYVLVSSSRFENNTSSSNMMSLVSTLTTVEHSLFVDNFSQLINNGITVTNSEMNLNNVTVNFTDQEFILRNTYEVDTCFFSINFQSKVTISASTIQNCRGGTAGVLQASGHSSIYIANNSRFLDNKSSVDGSGSALYFLTTDEVVISDSYFAGNGIVDVYVQRSTAEIRNSTFERGERQFVYGQAAGIVITNSTFRNSINQQMNGQALYCYCYSLVVSGSLFQNLSGVQGGALYLTSQTPSASFSLLRNTFSSNFAQQGGAVYISDAASASLLGNTFTGNEAQVISPSNEETALLVSKGLGGALFLQCRNLKAKLANNCSVSLGEGNVFEGNVAEDDGGAIIRVANVFASDGTNVFEGNEALYGEDLATYPAFLEFLEVNNNDYYDPDYHAESEILEGGQSILLDKLVSGTAFSFKLQILDTEGKLYNTDYESSATLKSHDSSVDILLNGNEVKSHGGVFDFSGVTAIVEPGSNVTLALEISGMNDFGNSISFLEEPVQIQLQFRMCVAGEQMQNYACEPCDYAFYMYDAPTDNTNCKDCDEDVSVCLGKNIVYPKPGYWRTSNTSEEWIECPRRSSCLEGSESQLSANCARGYEGIVCGECSSGYSKTGDFECSACPDTTSNAVKISFLGAFVVLVVVLLVFSTFSGAQKKVSGYSVYIKIMASHFQIISALANINFEWPQYIEALYSTLVEISQVSEQVFSIDCFLIDATSSVTKSVGVYFTKLLLFGLLPIILAILDLLFWLVVAMFKGSLQNFWNHFVSTLVILLFLVHPTISQEMFQAFNCVEIGDVYYLRDDIAYQCYQGQHLRFILIIVIPSVVLWSFGIPLTALLYMLRKKDLFMKEDKQLQMGEEERQELKRLRLRFGFIFNGFKTSSFYYEVVIQFRKVLLIMVTVIMSVVSPEIQTLLSLFILLMSMWVQYTVSPFLSKTLNRMETLSLVVALTTMYSGMYFITAQHYQYQQSVAMQWVFLILLVVPNIAYFLYWMIYMVIEIYCILHRRSKRMFNILSLGLIDYEKFGRKYLEETQMVVDGGQEMGQSMYNLNEPSSVLQKDQNFEILQPIPSSAQKVNESVAQLNNEAKKKKKRRTGENKSEEKESKVKKLFQKFREQNRQESHQESVDMVMNSRSKLRGEVAPVMRTRQKKSKKKKMAEKMESEEQEETSKKSQFYVLKNRKKREKL